MWRCWETSCTIQAEFLGLQLHSSNAAGSLVWFQVWSGDHPSIILSKNFQHEAEFVLIVHILGNLMYKNCTARISHLSWTHLSGLMSPWSSLEIWRKLQKICHMLLLMMDLQFGGNFFVTVFAKLCRIMLWIMGPSQKKELQNQGWSQMESLELLWVSPAPAPGCSSSSPNYSAVHALLVLHLDHHMPAKIEGYHMTHDHPLSMISIPITTRKCGFFSHKKKPLQLMTRVRETLWHHPLQCTILCDLYRCMYYIAMAIWHLVMTHKFTFCVRIQLLL